MKKVWLLAIVFAGFFTSAFAQKDSTLKEYTGNFIFPEGSVITYVNIVYSDSLLVYNSEQGKGILTKQKEDTFAIPSHSGTAFFTRDGEKRVAGIIIDVMGYHLVGTKEKEKS